METGRGEMGSGKRGLSLLFAAVCTVTVLAVVMRVHSNYAMDHGVRHWPVGGDFLQEWIGGYILLEGDRSRMYEDAYSRGLERDANVVGYEWEAEGALPIVYPPFYYLAVSPLSLLPMHLAAAVWVVLMGGCFGGAVWLLARYEDASARLWPWGMLVACLYFPLWESLGTGQKGTVLLLLFTATYLLLRHGRSLSAGMVFGLVAFKPQLLFVMLPVMAWKRDWRFLAGVVATGVLLGGISLIAGWDVCVQFVKQCLGMGNYMDRMAKVIHRSCSWWGAWKVFLDGTSEGVVKGAAGVSMCLTLWVLGQQLAGRLDYTSPKFGAQYAGIVVASLLISPHLLTYDLTVLLLPFAIIGSGVQRMKGRLLGNGMAAGLVVMGMYWLSFRGDEFAAQHHLPVIAPGLLGLLWFLEWQCREITAGEGATSPEVAGLQGARAG